PAVSSGMSSSFGSGTAPFDFSSQALRNDFPPAVVTSMSVLGRLVVVARHQHQPLAWQLRFRGRVGGRGDLAGLGIVVSVRSGRHRPYSNLSAADGAGSERGLSE